MKLDNTKTKVFFTSDCHFGHQNILKFCPDTRLGCNADEHDDVLIYNWQQQVAPDDFVFVLGDFTFSNAERTEWVLNQLPGNIVLIYGNHDKVIKSNIHLQNKFYSIHEYLRLHLDSCVAILFHYPIVEFDSMQRGAFHFYGHVHGKDMRLKGRHFDVGIDSRPQADMKLWSWEELKAIMLTRPILQHG